MPANLDQLKNELLPCCVRLKNIAFAELISAKIGNNYHKSFAPLQSEDEKDQDSQYEFYLATDKLLDRSASSIDQVGKNEIGSILMAHRFGMSPPKASAAVEECAQQHLVNEALIALNKEAQARATAIARSLDDLKARISQALLIDGDPKDKVQRIVDCIKATNPDSGLKPPKLYALFFEALIDNNLIDNETDVYGRKRIVWGQYHRHDIQIAESARFKPLDNLEADEFVLKAIIYHCGDLGVSNPFSNIRSRSHSYCLALHALFDVNSANEMIFFPPASPVLQDIISLIDPANFAQVNRNNVREFSSNLALNIAIAIRKSNLFVGAGLHASSFEWNCHLCNYVFVCKAIKAFDPLYATHPLYVLIKSWDFSLRRDIESLPIGGLIVGELPDCLDFHGYEHLQIDRLSQEQNRGQLYRTVTSIWGHVDHSKMEEVISKVPLYGMNVEQQDYVIIRLYTYHITQEARNILFMPDDVVMQEPRLIYGNEVVPEDKVRANEYLKWAIRSYLLILIPQIEQSVCPKELSIRWEEARIYQILPRDNVSEIQAYQQAKLYAIYKEMYFNFAVIWGSYNTPRIKALLGKFGVAEDVDINVILWDILFQSSITCNVKPTALEESKIKLQILNNRDILLQSSTSCNVKHTPLEEFKIKLQMLNNRYPGRLRQPGPIVLTCLHSLGMSLILRRYISGYMQTGLIRGALVCILCIVALTDCIAYVGKRMSNHNDIVYSGLETSLAGRLIEQVIARRSLDCRHGVSS